MSRLIPTITITGTKGKTTTTYVIGEVLRRLGHNVLRVDTTGHYVNGVQKSGLEDSKAVWKLVPTVAPGRYLWEFAVNPALQKKAVAVLEAALGSSSLSGLGYKVHDVGVFLNVFEDHLGSSARIQNKSDIAVAKEFIFSRITRNGVAVFNADDELVVRSLRTIPPKIGIKLLPVGQHFTYFDLEKHLQRDGEAIMIADNKVWLKKQTGDRVLVDLTVIPWTFGGAFTPSGWNIACAAGAVYAFLGKKWSTKVRAAFESTRLDSYGGRLTVLRAKNGAIILADYAHEKVSLRMVAELSRTLVRPGGKLVGVVRLAHDRTDKLIHETGQVIGREYDYCIVYDKIDGHLKKPQPVLSSRFPQIVGRTSEILANGISQTNQHVDRIVREDKALQRAAEFAGPEDVVVVIVNDDIGRSIGFIRKFFGADFI